MAKLNRTTWGKQFDRCMGCGGKNLLQTHEICRGPFRAAATKEPAAWLRLCQVCHDDLPPIVVQLAWKKIGDPEHYNRVAVNLLRKRQPEAITEAEVDEEVRRIQAKPP